MHRLEELLNHLRTLKDPIVVGHEGADPDAVASAYAVGRLLRAPMGFPGDPSREGEALLRFLREPYEVNPNVKGKDLVVVDTSSKDMLGDLNVEEARSVTVIDHHDSEPTLRGKLFIFRDASSTSEIAYLLLRESGLRLDEKLRTALTYGIFYDTKGFQLATPGTLRILADVLQDRTPITALEGLLRRNSISERIARLKALREGKIVRIGDFLVTYTETGSFEGSVADILIEAGADVAIAYSSSHTLDRLSLRLSSEAIRAGLDGIEMCDVLERSLGASCGGHKGAAGCRLPPKTGTRAAQILVDWISRKLNGDASKIRRY